MPKVSRDEELARAVKDFVVQMGGFSAAARELRVDRTLLWRFCKNGCAIQKTRAHLAAALTAVQSASSTFKKDTKDTVSDVGLLPTVEELAQIRRFLTKMIALVDACDRASSSPALRTRGSHLGG